MWNVSIFPNMVCSRIALELQAEVGVCRSSFRRCRLLNDRRRDDLPVRAYEANSSSYKAGDMGAGHRFALCLLFRLQLGYLSVRKGRSSANESLCSLLFSRPNVAIQPG